jgi:hypothetical protein
MNNKRKMKKKNKKNKRFKKKKFSIHMDVIDER